MKPTDMESNLSQPLVHNDGGCRSDQMEGEVGVAAADVMYRKISQRVLPVFFMVILVCYLDRTNISLAAAGMSKDIGISKGEYGIAASLFFVSYIAFQIPSNAVLKRVGAPLWMGIILIAWGVTASLTAFVRDAVHLYFMRLLLGAFEAGTFPGSYYYLSLFYPEKRISFALSVIAAGLLMGLCISAPLGGGLLSMDGVLGFGGWQWLLFVEGFPAVLLGVFMMFYLPKLPSSCNFLSAKEKSILEGHTPSNTTPSIAQLMKTIVLNSQLWINAIGWNLQGTARYAAQFWTPLWINAIASGKGLDLKNGLEKGQGNNDNGALAAFLTTIPYCCAAISSVVVGWSSSRLNDRKVHVIVITGVGAIIFCLLPLVNGWGLVPGIAALTLINIAVGSTNALFVALASHVMTSDNKGFGYAWFNSLGNFCGLVGPLAVGLIVDWTKSYIASFYFASAILFMSALMYLFVKESDQSPH